MQQSHNGPHKLSQGGLKQSAEDFSSATRKLQSLKTNPSFHKVLHSTTTLTARNFIICLQVSAEFSLFWRESSWSTLKSKRDEKKKSKLKKVQGQKSRFTLGTSWLRSAQAAPRKGCTSDRHALGSQWHLVAPKPLCRVYSKLLVIPFSETLLLLYIKAC